jgi:hypothetical protein
MNLGDHVRAKDAEGRYTRGWIVTIQGKHVQLDLADILGNRTGHLLWLKDPEPCEVYIQPAFRYFEIPEGVYTIKR